jgi:hypothetical protein
MKKNIFMMLVILVTTYANSQNNDFVCTTPNNYDSDPEGVYSYSTDPIINNLDSGLYKVEKTYDDGSTQETVIYKENNL